MIFLGLLSNRSLPDLEVVGEVSLMSTLRWSFKTNMDKTISSNNGQIALVITFFLHVEYCLTNF